MGVVKKAVKKVYGLIKILTQLRKRRAKLIGDGFSEVKVGYRASYAVPVHERLDLHHPNGQAKFLEQPMRTEADTMAAIIRSRLMAHERLVEAQLAAAKHLMSVSLTLVPRKTGYLANSYFIEPAGRGGFSGGHTGFVNAE